jgi:hypothetical protein
VAVRLFAFPSPATVKGNKMLAPYAPSALIPQPYGLYYGSGTAPLVVVIPDDKWPGMYRLVWPGGRSDLGKPHLGQGCRRCNRRARPTAPQREATSLAASSATGHRKLAGACKRPEGSVVTRDRASAIAHVMLQIVARHILAGDETSSVLHAQITEQLRDEIADIRRQTLNEIRPEDG